MKTLQIKTEPFLTIQKYSVKQSIDNHTTFTTILLHSHDTTLLPAFL